MSSVTKRALAASFKKLLGTRALDKITVKDIVEDAQVNRQTFYYHYHDIYDLVRWIFDEETRLGDVLEDKSCDWKAYLRDVFKTMTEERTMVINVFHSLCREHLEQYLYGVMYKLICNKLDDLCRDLTLSDEDRRFIADCYKYAIVGVILDWIRRGMRDDPEQLVDKLILMLEGRLRPCAEKFSS